MKYQKIAIRERFCQIHLTFCTHTRCTHPPVSAAAGPTCGPHLHDSCKRCPATRTTASQPHASTRLCTRVRHPHRTLPRRPPQPLCSVLPAELPASGAQLQSMPAQGTQDDNIPCPWNFAPKRGMGTHACYEPCCRSWHGRARHHRRGTRSAATSLS
jgi:hypothetical protein